jgi:radical SAM protein with 4Fe4S-binding SPASM domain
VPSMNDFLILSPDCHLKKLEQPYVYNIRSDELYEVNWSAYAFLKLCNGSHRLKNLKYRRNFLNWCLKENILETKQDWSRRRFVLYKSAKPSLRYLELQITARCNLKCRHCYLGEPAGTELPISTIHHTMQQFERMQGLRLLISGGEPLLHSRFWEINALIPKFAFRSILLTNGTLIDGDVARRLNVHEVQVSLDGMQKSHDLLRGKGSFDRAMGAIQALKGAQMDVSIATMVHAANLHDFPALDSLIRKIGIKEWTIDVPCPAGRYLNNDDLHVDYGRAAAFLKYGFGGGLYTSSAGYACGAHLCTVMPDGMVAKCGFFASDPAGHISQGLRSCWRRIQHIKLEALDCECDFKEECRGGCRFRALKYRGIYAPDPVQCHLRGVAVSC